MPLESDQQVNRAGDLQSPAQLNESTSQDPPKETTSSPPAAQHVANGTGTALTTQPASLVARSLIPIPPTERDLPAQSIPTTAAPLVVRATPPQLTPLKQASPGQGPPEQLEGRLEPGPPPEQAAPEEAEEPLEQAPPGQAQAEQPLPEQPLPQQPPPQQPPQQQAALEQAGGGAGGAGDFRIVGAELKKPWSWLQLKFPIGYKKDVNEYSIELGRHGFRTHISISPPAPIPPHDGEHAAPADAAPADADAALADADAAPADADAAPAHAAETCDLIMKAKGLLETTMNDDGSAVTLLFRSRRKAKRFKKFAILFEHPILEHPPGEADVPDLKSLKSQPMSREDFREKLSKPSSRRNFL